MSVFWGHSSVMFVRNLAAQTSLSQQKHYNATHESHSGKHCCCMQNCNVIVVRPKKKLLCCPLPTDRKMRKNRVRFFFFFFCCCWKCQIWAKNLLKFVFNGLKMHLYMRFDCIPPEFSPFRNLKKKIGKLNSLTVRKKKKKKNRPTDRPNFQILVGWGQHNFFFLA